MYVSFVGLFSFLYVSFVGLDTFPIVPLSWIKTFRDDFWFLSLDKGFFATIFQISRIFQKSKFLQQIEKRSDIWDLYLLHERGLLLANFSYFSNFSKVGCIVSIFTANWAETAHLRLIPVARAWASSLLQSQQLPPPLVQFLKSQLDRHFL